MRTPCFRSSCCVGISLRINHQETSNTLFSWQPPVSTFLLQATKFLNSLLVLQTPFWNTRTRPSSLRINQTSAHSPPLSCLDAHFIVWFAICWTHAHHFQFLSSKSPATNKKLSALCWLNLKLLKMNAKKVTTCKHTVIHCFSPFCLYTDPFLVCGSVPCCVKGGF